MLDDVIDLEPIKSWIVDGKVSVIDANVCDDFNSYISEKYPWYGYIKDRIDWELVGGFKRLNWEDASDSETMDFVKTTCLSKYSSLAVMYGASEPGICGDFNFIINNLETLNLFGMAGAFFIIGASKNAYGIYELHHKDFMELWSLKLLLTAPC